jgi:ribosomal protein S12 methylthiotransferase accessory factor
VDKVTNLEIRRGGYKELRLKSCIKNEYGKCDSPEHTVARVEEWLREKGIEYRSKAVSPSEKAGLHWAWVKLPCIDYYTNGKGTTPILAKASALSEMIERLSSYFFDIVHSRISLDWMLHNPAIYKDFRDFRYMAGYEYGHEDEIKNPIRIEEILPHSGFSAGDIEYIKDHDAGKHWVDGYSLTREEEVKVPLRLVSRVSSSNGLAAGNTLEEAIVQASCEVFERYALRMLIERKSLPTIDIETIVDPGILEMIDYFKVDSVDVKIKDMSVGGLLPVVGILTRNERLPTDDCDFRILQPGADFNPINAVKRCFTERMQGRRSPSEATLNVKYYAMKAVPTDKINDYWDLFTDRKYYADMSFMEDGDTVPLQDREVIEDCLEEIGEIRGICRELDTDCVVVDHTLAGSPLKAIRVIIPGLSDLIPYIDPAYVTKERLADESEEQAAVGRGLLDLSRIFDAVLVRENKEE